MKQYAAICSNLRHAADAWQTLLLECLVLRTSDVSGGTLPLLEGFLRTVGSLDAVLGVLESLRNRFRIAPNRSFGRPMLTVATCVSFFVLRACLCPGWYYIIKCCVSVVSYATLFFTRARTGL